MNWFFSFLHYVAAFMLVAALVVGRNTGRNTVTDLFSAFRFSQKTILPPPPAEGTFHEARIFLGNQLP